MTLYLCKNQNLELKFHRHFKFKVRKRCTALCDLCKLNFQMAGERAVGCTTAGAVV